jgi:glycosyltransferase involved in cell wall biosynthesis
MILRDPEDSQDLAGLLRALCANPDLCRQIGQEAWLTARQQTWDRNAEAIWQLLKDAARKHSARVLHGKP